MPGLVSTLLNQAYSTPSRLVQTFLQVTEQVWQPMHLSRLSTMPICALIFIADSPEFLLWAAGRSLRPRVPYLGWSIQSTFFILRTTTNSSRLAPTVP